MIQIPEGSDIKGLFDAQLNGVDQNLDNYIDIFVVVTDKSGREIIAFSKSGATGTTQLVMVNENQYMYIIDSSITKLLGRTILKVAFNFVSADADLVDGRFNELGFSEAYEVNTNPAAKYS